MDIEKIYKTCMNNPDFAYWVGVAQSDGYFKKITHKKTKVIRYFISLRIGLKSIPMQNKFIEISQKILKIKGCKSYYKNGEGFDQFDYQFGCKNLLLLFKQLKLNFSQLIPNKFIIKNKKMFGAYLAGIIDGDGDVRLKRPQYPQCIIRITSSKKPIELMKNIKLILKCGINSSKHEQISTILNRTFNSSSYRTEFSVSPKNFK
jgi:hypothetical protein